MILIPEYRQSMATEPTANFAMLSIQEKAAYLESMRLEIRRRVKEIKTAKEYSFGVEALENALKQIGVQSTRVTITKKGLLGINFRNRSSERAIDSTLLQTYGLYKDFLNPAETATNSLEGVLAVNRAQDAMLFGTDSSGEPNRTMTTNQRRRFWDLVDTVRASDIISPADEYFFRDSKFQRMFFSSKFTHSTMRGKLKALADYFEKQKGPHPPMEPLPDESGSGENKTLAEELYEKYIGITERRSR